MSEEPAGIRDSWNANAAAWTELSRSGADRLRDLVNTPAFFRRLPPVAGLRCLDVGCGEGHNTRLLAQQKAEVVGIDLAEAFLGAAVGMTGDGISYLQADGVRLPFKDETFDAVTAFMSLHDAASPELMLIEIARVLRPGGFTQFSVIHPVMNTRIGEWVSDESGARTARLIGDYFYQGPMTETWIFGAVPATRRDSYRPFTITYTCRTLSGWLAAVLGAGLAIEAVDEPHADEATASAHPEVADSRVAPYILLVRARKPG
jgi:2-polyprenyl-3-methyl-5-hydroxy-6-metoxy-1,4-benzoquinol methylase